MFCFLPLADSRDKRQSVYFLTVLRHQLPDVQKVGFLGRKRPEVEKWVNAYNERQAKARAMEL